MFVSDAKCYGRVLEMMVELLMVSLLRE